MRGAPSSTEKVAPGPALSVCAFKGSGSRG